MERYECWPPPPDWDQVVITWQTMLDRDSHRPPLILAWMDQYPGGRYHLHGWESWQQYPAHGRPPQSIDGFAFRFERPQDAVMFALTWCTD